MPTPNEILAGLAEITQRWRALAIVWHMYFGVLAAGLIVGVRPSKPVTGILLSIPLFSVSVLAWQAANPFNGSVFALVAIALVILSLRLPREPVTIAQPWVVAVGIVMVVFGWVYPHFVEAGSVSAYLYATPTGLIPCPTLSIVIGFALVLGGFDSRWWSIVLSAAGLFYGLFGALRLGVTIDLVLFAGAGLLFGLSLFPHLSKPVDTTGQSGMTQKPLGHT